MGYFQAIVLGAVQGLTEFLPVSSSAHLILARMLLGWDAERLGLAFDVACHAGTLLAVLVYFRRDLWAMAKALPGMFRGAPDGPARTARFIVIGTLPVVVVGLMFADTIETQLRTPAVTVVTLTLGALGFLLAERFGSQARGEEELGTVGSLAVGCAQAAALVPGVSRSGATITMAMLLGVRREAAARFSFLLGVPAIAAAAGHAGLKTVQTGLSVHDAGLFAVGLVVSGLVGIVAIHYLLRYLARHSLMVFAWYRLGVAAVVAVWILTGRG